ncbi:MAG: 50S ribosomal protein L30 [Alphaproteobacteria bacterium]|jgi:large subunit ribosomal protein L30|nr:50S ribosomal protein L30 [Alphaproteobacteria bacterium]
MSEQGYLKITQTRSGAGRSERQQATLVGLGLNKMHRARVWRDTPEVRGRIAKVHHLVSVVAVDGPEG